MTYGAFLRSQSKWIEQGEKSTSFFLNLEKAHQNSNKITKLIDINSKKQYNSDKDILKDCASIYSKLYTSIFLFGILRCFQHCTGHITTGSWKGRGTSTYSSLGFCTVNCQPTASNYQLSHLRPCRESNPGLRGGRRECYHSATMAPAIYK